MARLELKNISKSYGSAVVIKDVELSIEHREFVVFVGPSGCGKSTLLKMIAGLEEISGGELWIGDRIVNDIEPRDRGIAMVFQSYALYPHMTVYDNVGFSLKIAGAPKDVRDAKIREAARILQMEHLLDRKPSQLSGGQRQRVAIGRAIVRHPEVFLFDEPLSNLDAALRVDMRMELSRLHAELDATMIYVTHDQVEAMTLADKIVVLDGGRVQQVGSPIELYQRPANLFVAGFIGSPKMNFVEVNVVSARPNEITVVGKDVAEVTIPADGSAVSAKDRLTLGFRPQELVPAASGPLTGRVELVERLGSETIVNLTLASGASAFAVLDGDKALTRGDTVTFGLDLARALLFGADGQSLLAPRP